MVVLWLVPYGDNQGGGVVEENGCICVDNLHNKSPSLMSGPLYHLVCSLQTVQSCIGICLLYLKPRVASCIYYLLGLILG